ncbi:MAG TPA: hypothetical protein EYN31_03385 [Candidatus Marinimicrobia bacterium]|nr:hypothetical protein [Candidatus Neomarinimicrobiota bacterium]
MDPNFADGNLIKYAKAVNEEEFLKRLEPHKDTLARMEHERWRADKWFNDWEYGEPRDNDNKKHPDLLPFDELGGDAQKKDQDTVENMHNWLVILRSFS